MNRMAFASCAALAASASAQNIATWYWTVSDTGNGDGLVEPGESALLELFCAFEPPPPPEGGYAGPTTYYDIVGDDGWKGGTIDWFDDYFCDGVYCGEVQPNNDIAGMVSYQLPPHFNPFFDASNPMPICAVRWTPDSYGGQSVTLDNGGPDLSVYTDGWGSTVVHEGAGGLVTFRVAPAPGALALAAAAALGASRRRR